MKIKLPKVWILLGLILTMTGCGQRKQEALHVVESLSLTDGLYEGYATLTGGTGKATLENPTKIEIKEQTIYATLIWSSSNYDYMLVDEKKYENEAELGEPSRFTIPIAQLDCDIPVVADTTAMSTPHEISYILKLSLKKDDGDAKETEKSAEANEKQKEKIDFSYLGEKKVSTLNYATEFSLEAYGDYKVIRIQNGDTYLIVPKNTKVPKSLPKEVKVINQPIQHTYLVSTSVMDCIDKLGALSQVTLTGTKKKDWYLKPARQAMEKQKLLYAGKYSAPDYELLLEKQCDLAIENTMIYHNPEVKEKLEELKIPVFVERSSYEKHPLGRLEWVKAYGALFGKEEAACDFYEEQVSQIEPVLEQEATGKTVAYFYCTTNGAINVRKPNDYIAKMIELAGGEYVLKNTLETEENGLSTMNMEIESFYYKAKDADILIYNSTIDGELEGVDELLRKNEIFKEFKAVKENEVYCTTSNFFQESTGTCAFIQDLHSVMKKEEKNFTYLKKLK